MLFGTLRHLWTYSYCINTLYILDEAFFSLVTHLWPCCVQSGGVASYPRTLQYVETWRMKHWLEDNIHGLWLLDPRWRQCVWLALSLSVWFVFELFLALQHSECQHSPEVQLQWSQTICHLHCVTYLITSTPTSLEEAPLNLILFWFVSF